MSILPRFSKKRPFATDFAGVIEDLNDVIFQRKADV